MGYSKDNSRVAKLAAEEALTQAQRAELASDYIEEKQPLIDEFVDEQTNLQTQLNDLVLQSGTDIAEVVQARGGEVTLHARLEKTTALLADMGEQKADKTEVNNLGISKADKTLVDSNYSILNTKINSQASGSPKGSYATLALLQAAFPTGNTNIYLVTTGATAGHWYYWNGSAWTDGGVYQSILGDAAKINIVDVENTFTSTEVEGALKEVVTKIEDVTAFTDSTTTGIETTVATAANHSPTSQFVSALQPFYLTNQDVYRGEYITKIGFKVTALPSQMSIVFKNVQTTAEVLDQNIDGVYCTITPTTTDWTEYDLTNLADTRISFVSANLTDGKIFLPSSNRIFGFGQKDEVCKTAYDGATTGISRPEMQFYISANKAVASYSLAFDIYKTEYTTVVGRVYKNDVLQEIGQKINLLEQSSEPQNYSGKHLSILGDSISTYTDWNPIGNAVFYTGSNLGVSSVEQTWWKRLLNQTGMNLCVNNAWSGSRVTGVDSSAGSMARATDLHTTTQNPDVIIVYLGINDFNNEVALGTYNGVGAFPTDTTTFREAYAIMLSKILNQYKNAEVYVGTLPDCERNGTATFPEINGNGVLLADWNKAIRELADLFGVSVLEFSKSGLTFYNKGIYLADDLHPNSNGHKLLANKAIKTIDPNSKYSTIS